MSPTNRPAETTALAAALAFLIARAAGLDDDETMTALTVVIGALPALITWIVNRRRSENR